MLFTAAMIKNVLKIQFNSNQKPLMNIKTIKRMHDTFQFPINGPSRKGDRGNGMWKETLCLSLVEFSLHENSNRVYY